MLNAEEETSGSEGPRVPRARAMSHGVVHTIHEETRSVGGASGVTSSIVRWTYSPRAAPAQGQVVARSRQPVRRSNTWGHASGTSAVAIDNKIEQAMDLVKSHLMFAVREEVEVLKEKIAELMDRINQLELENTILKANASQETLAQLSTGGPTKTQPTQQPPNGSVS